MNHDDHMRLLREGVVPGVWADLGAGTGAFTLALADLMADAAEAVIYAIDKDGSALKRQSTAMQTRFPKVTVHYEKSDFTKELKLPALDGIVMANSLHFVRRKMPVLQRIRQLLKPKGRLVIVEYNADSGNMWVPHPFSYPTWEKLAEEAGFVETRLLETYPSRFLREIYSAVSFQPSSDS